MNKAAAAKAWRLKLGLTVPQLAELSGFAENTIWLFERGDRSEGISEWSWQRYRMACAGVEAEIRSGRKFEW